MNQTHEDKNICTHCSSWLDAIKEIRNFTEAELHVLERPEKVFTCTIPVTMDDGSVQRFNGYRVQYNTALGPAKGGLRYHQDVDLEEAQTLAFLMSLKTSLAGLPLGGGKGGIEIDVENISDTEKEGLTRSFTRQLQNVIGPDTDVPAPDVNTNAEVMDWIVDEYSKVSGEYTPTIVTGKSIENGGSLGREKATSLGGAFVLRKILSEQSNKKPEEITVAVQGFGNVGKNIAEILSEWGFNVIAVSNAKGGIYNKAGLDIASIINQGNDFSLQKDVEFISNEDLLVLDVDVLILAAISDQITIHNMNSVRANFILEMANAPITQDADHSLHARGVFVIPDILANAGGVIVSYYEWLQNKKNEKWSEDEVNSRLETQIITALDSVLRYSKDNTEHKNISMRYSAYITAIENIFAAEKKREWL